MNSRLSFALFLGGLLLTSPADAGPSSTAVHGIKGETLVVQVKSDKHKHDNDGDNHHKKNGKNAKNDQSDESASGSDQGSKVAKTTPDSTSTNHESPKTTTTPNAATTNQNVLWGDYLYTDPKQ